MSVKCDDIKKIVLCFISQRYYYYIRNGIGTEDVAPMEDSWLKNVLALIPEQLRSLRGTTEALSDEMREDYILSIKKAIGTIFTFTDLCIWKVDTALV